MLRRTSYARNLALLIMLAASTAVFVNYVFKAETAAVYQGDDLLRFFSGFYMVASLLTTSRREHVELSPSPLQPTHAAASRTMRVSNSR